MASSSRSRIDYVVFLNREASCLPGIHPFSKDEAYKRLHHSLFGDKAMREVQDVTLRNLLSAEVLELGYQDLNDGVDQLKSLVCGDRAYL
jgi:hypothetical protein